MKNTALLFDMDGVLVDVTHSYRLAIKQTAEAFLGRGVDFKEIQSYKNRGGFNDDWDLTEAIIRSAGKRVSKKVIIKDTTIPILRIFFTSDLKYSRLPNSGFTFE